MDLFSDLQSVSLSGDGEHFIVTAQYSSDANEAMRKHFPGVRHDRSRAVGTWVVPATAAHAQTLKHKLGGFAWTREAQSRAAEVATEEAQRQALSKAVDANLHLPGFGMNPYGYQKAGIAYALERKRVIIGDEMGLGKTLQGLGTIYGADAFPALIVVPPSLKYRWADEEIKTCMPHLRCVIANKKTSPLLLRMADIIVTNYQQMYAFRPIKYWDEDKQKWVNSRSAFTDETKKEVILSDLAKNLLELPRPLAAGIWDEAHNLKDSGTAQYMANHELVRTMDYRILLSGTPMMNNPSEFASLLKFIGMLDHFGGWFHFMTEWCGMRKGRFKNWEPTAGYDVTPLNEKLRALCYVRRKKDDVLTELPPKTRGHIPVDLDNQAEYDKAENELIEWVKERVHRDEVFLASIAHLTPDEQAKAIAVRKADKAAAAERAEAIVKFNALKTVAAEGKLSSAKEWIDDFLKSGEKLVVFAMNKHIIAQLLKWYPKAARIIGDDDPQERQRNAQKFQTDPNCNLLIGAMGTSATSSPAGVGWTLTASSTTLTIQLGWNNALHDQCEDRCHRIGQRSHVTAYYMLARGTVDLDIAELIESKRQLCKEVVDGSKGEDESGILDELMARFASRV